MNIEDIKELVKIISENGVESFEINEGDLSIKIKMPTKSEECTIPAGQRNFISQTQTSSEILVQNDSESTLMTATKNELDFNNLTEIKSPMVGVYYASPSPDSPAFIEVGQKVKKGDVLCIIEAMKLMNEIVAEQDGEIVDICVENGQVVEYSQTMFKLF